MAVRYFIFAYDDCYPKGGFGDFVESHEYRDEAITSAKYLDFDRVQVVDTQDETVIYSE